MTKHDSAAEAAEPRIILITGCTRGLGRALTERWASEGHTLIGCGRNEAQLEQLGTELGPRHHFSRVDVADAEDVDGWAKTVLAAVGVPHLVLNNAALINERAPLWQVPVAEFSQVIDVNLKGVHNVVRSFVPALIEAGRGIVINISSGWGKFSAPDVGPYCTTKFGIEGYTGSLAEDLPKGLAAIPLQPGIIHTDMLDTAFGQDADQHWTPDQWIEVAAPFILSLGPEHNGQSLRIPDA